MGWVNRNGRRYYYESRREGERIVSRYVGAEVIGQFAEKLARDERRKKQRKQEQERAERERSTALSREVAALYKGIDAVLRECLEQAGYHQHARGQWRKRRKAVNDGE